MLQLCVAVAAVVLGAPGGASPSPRLPPVVDARPDAPGQPDAEFSRYVAPRAISHYLRARVALARGAEREAAGELDLAVAFAPSSAGLRAAAADLFLALGNPGRASGEAHRAIALGGATHPAAVIRGHAVLGRIAASELRWKAAAAELATAGQLADAARARGDDATGGALEPEDRFVHGVALEALRSWSEAASAFAGVSGAADPLGALAALREAQALSMARRHAEAREAVARARRPGDVRFIIVDAQVLGRSGDTEGAVAVLRRELEARSINGGGGPATVDLVEALAATLVEGGRAHEAIDALQRALEVRPRDRALLLGLGAALERSGDLDGAEARVAQVLEEDADDVEALNFVGYLLADRGVRLHEAERLLARAAQLAPRNGAVLDSLGWLHFRRGRHDDAIRLLERAAAVAGPDATILDHLGDAYLASRRRTDATRAWQRALAELDADPPAAAGEAARARLQREAIAAKIARQRAARAVR